MDKYKKKLLILDDKPDLIGKQLSQHIMNNSNKVMFYRRMIIGYVNQTSKITIEQGE